jgi:hypothetical protein
MNRVAIIRFLLFFVVALLMFENRKKMNGICVSFGLVLFFVWKRYIEISLTIYGDGRIDDGHASAAEID